MIENELTSQVFWYYVNSLYFPFDSLDRINRPFEEYIAPLLFNLKRDN